MKSLSKFITLLFIILTFSCSNEPIGNVIAEDVITVNSELYNQLERIANTEDDENISCIEFAYPLTIFTFNENLEFLNWQAILGDQQFSDLLESLDDSYSISVSYPITSTLNDGSTFSIETNEELKEAIDNCIREEIIIECQGIIDDCVWYIAYQENNDNIYFGGVFQESNGATSFAFEGNTYFGSWSPLYIEDELHLNIYLDDQGQVGADMNFDWKAQFNGTDSILLTYEDRVLVLNKVCDNNITCPNGPVYFQECELQDYPGFAEFILDDYNICIGDIIDADNVSVTYFETIVDSETNNNAIIASEPYINTSQSQTIWVRIENIDTQEFIVIPITISAIIC